MVLLYEMMIVSGAVMVFMTLFCLYVAMTSRRMSLIDMAWPVAFLVAALTAYVRNGEITHRKIMVGVLLLLWAVRLGYHLILRLSRQHAEDPRYVRLYGSWDTLGVMGAWFYLYAIQGIIATIIVLPVVVVMYSGNIPFTLFDMIGVLVWCVGFVCESLADYQLSVFVRQAHQPGVILNTGLWRYSRHPNYFGELLMWIGMWLITVSLPYGMVTIISPITISYLLQYVSGIPLVEEQFKGNSAYDAYKKHTNSMIPWVTHQ